METTEIKKSYLWLNTRKYFVEHRKTLIILTAGFLGFCIVCGVWSGIIGITPGSTSEAFYVFAAGLLCAVAASLTFNELSGKEGRISFIMTPGTALDKYLPRVITTVIGMSILSIIGFYVLHASQIISYGISHKIWLPWDAGSVEVNEEGLAESIFALIGMFLFNEALFVLGSAAWPKKSFLKTMCVFIVLQMALSLIGFVIAENFKFTMYVDPSNVFLIARCIITVIFIIDFLLFFWAYKKIEHIQVVSKS